MCTNDRKENTTLSHEICHTIYAVAVLIFLYFALFHDGVCNKKDE